MSPTPFFSPVRKVSVKQTYVAVDGDDLFSIAQRFYGSDSVENVAKIAGASGVLDAKDVQPGQIITIP